METEVPREMCVTFAESPGQELSPGTTLVAVAGCVTELLGRKGGLLWFGFGPFTVLLGQ